MDYVDYMNNQIQRQYEIADAMTELDIDDYDDYREYMENAKQEYAEAQWEAMNDR